MFVRVGDINIHVRIDGPVGAPPLLMLHSLGTDLRVWDPQADSLSRSFRVIRPDIRGHGLTTVSANPYVMDDLAIDALGVLDALGIRTAHVAGLSIGGVIAQAIAARSPDRVASLILCDTAMILPPPESWRDRAATVREQGIEVIADAVMGRWVTPAFAADPAAIGLRTVLLRTPREGYAAAAEAIAGADLRASTAKLRIPAVIIVGAHDEATPPASAEAMRDAIAESSLEVIPAAAHIPTVEKPLEVTDAIRRFLTPAVTDFYAAGMTVRKQVLGETHVARASSAITAFDKPFQEFITRTAWGGVWTRPGLDRRTRSLLTLALMAALGHHEEFKLHVRASRNTGATPEDIAEALIQVAAYAGIPAANSAVRIAKETFAEMGSESSHGDMR